MRSIAEILEELGLEVYVSKFLEEKIDDEIFLTLNNADLRELEIPLGHRKRLLFAIEKEVLGQSLAETSTELPERRRLTVLMCDLTGSTALANKLDPEDYRKIIQSFRISIDLVIQEYGGEIRQYEGDGLLAYFGYPIAHEDDISRAIKSALGVLDSIREIYVPGENQAKCRIGIATGNVVVEPRTGDEASKQGGAHGETPSMAKRLQECALPGQILICEETYDIAKNEFRCRETEYRTLKGFSEPQLLREISGFKVDRKNFETSAAWGNDTYVGREDEISRIKQAWEHVNSDSGRAVVVEGEPGIGKTRFVYEFINSLKKDERTCLKLLCSSYNTGSAFYPVIECLRRTARLNGGGREQNLQKEKLEKFLLGIDLSLVPYVELISDLMGMSEAETTPSSAVNPANLRAAIVKALISIVVTISSNRPTIIIVEDAQWIDASSLILISQIIRNQKYSKVLVIFCVRAGSNILSREFPESDLILLKPLSDENTKIIIENIAKKSELADLTIKEIISKTDGNPLFIEEFTKSTLSTGGRNTQIPIEAQELVPSSLQNSLLGRIDNVADQYPFARPLSQIVSTIGREFSIEFVSLICQKKERELTKTIDALVKAGVITLVSSQQNEIYQFSHALLKDAVYFSQLKSNRRRLHNSIALALIDNEYLGSNFEPELIARHFTAAENYWEGITWWRKAGLQAARLAANEEAGAHYEAGINLFQKMEVCGDQAKEATISKFHMEMLLEMGDVFRSAYGTSSFSAKSAYTRANVYAQNITDYDAGIHSLYGQFAAEFQDARISNARKIADLMINLGRAHEHNDSVMLGNQAIGICEFIRGEFLHSKNHLERALSGFDNRKDRISISYSQVPFTTLTYLSWTMFALGDLSMAMKYCDRALKISENSAAFTRSLTLANACYLFQMTDNVSRVKDSANILAQFSNKNGLPAWNKIAQFFIGWCEARNGDFESGISKMKRADVMSERIETPYFLAVLSEQLSRNGENKEALELSDQAIQLMSETKECWYESEIYRLRGKIKGALGRPFSEVEKCLAYSLKKAKKQNAKYWADYAVSDLDRLKSEINYKLNK